MERTNEIHSPPHQSQALRKGADISNISKNARYSDPSTGEVVEKENFASILVCSALSIRLLKRKKWSSAVVDWIREGTAILTGDPPDIVTVLVIKPVRRKRRCYLHTRWHPRSRARRLFQRRLLGNPSKASPGQHPSRFHGLPQQGKL
jgi:hypothetical protein